MTSRFVRRAAFGALALISLAAAVGCDDRNDPDTPSTVYHLKKTIATPGVAQNVDVKGDLLAVAASSAGTYVYNVSDAENPAQIFHFVPAGELYTEFVSLDAVNGFVLSMCAPSLAPGDKYPIHRLADSTRIGGAAFTSGTREVMIAAEPSHFVAWKLEQAARGVVYSQYCFLPDSNEWRPDYCDDFYIDYNAAFGLPRGFDIRDSLFAIAQDNYEIRVHNYLTGDVEALVQTPGDPYDCAWYGDYVLVADNYTLTVIDVADFSAASVVRTYGISGADRLQKIVVDGHYAILLDDSDGLYIVNVSDPLHPVLEQSISLPEVSSVSASNGVLVASDEQLGVLIYQR